MLRIVAAAAVVAGFGFMGTAPFIADYVVVVCGIYGLVLAISARDGVLTMPSSLALAAALVAFAVTIPFVYRSEADAFPLLAFAPVLVAPGLAALLVRQDAWLQPAAVPLLCLFGAITAAIAGIVEWQVTSEVRVGLGNNPIHYGGIVAVVGFLSLAGLHATTRWWRLLFLLGPLTGLGAVLLSGSRGPLLAWAAMALASLPFVVWWLRRDIRAMLILALLVGVIAAGLLTSSQGNRALAGLVTLAQSGGVQAVFGADAARTALYTSAWHAFLSSPLVGHGYGQLIPMVMAEFPTRTTLATLENLHSDLPNFAAMAGSLGVLSYLLLIAAPLLLLGSDAARRQPALVFGVVILTVGYVVLGLTNLMFGVLPQTALFAIALGYLMALRRQATAMPAPPGPQG